MRVLALSILVVAVTTALLIRACFRLVREAERTQRDPKWVRRLCLVLASLYIAAAVYSAVEIAIGNEPPMGLIGFPIAALFIWNLIRRVSNVKTPPP
jgi:hypothetical protein